MQILITLSKSEEKTLNALIDLSLSFGLDKALFATANKKFLDEHEWIIQNPFKDNGILDWHPEGCGTVKFKFTNLGLALIKSHRPEIIEKMKPFFPFRYPHVSEHYLPNVKLKIIKQKTTV